MKASMFHLFLSLAVVLPLTVAQAKEANDAPPVDESQAVELFQAMDDGLVEAKLTARNSLESSITVTNKTNQPIVVEMPRAFAGVPVLAQPPGGGMGNFGGGGFGMAAGGFGGDAMGMAGDSRSSRMGGMGGSRNGGSSSGGNQSVGGGMGGRSGGMGGMGGGMSSGRGGRGGGGMFSIAPNSTHKESVRTVCLEHGKKEPSYTVKYALVPIDNYTDNKTTQVLCEMLGDEELDQKGLQAAVWNAENGLTFDELAAKEKRVSANNPIESYFSAGELQNGLSLLEQATERAEVLENVEKAQDDLEENAPEATDSTVEVLTEQVLSE